MPHLYHEPSEKAGRTAQAAVPGLASELERAYSDTRRSEDELRSVVHDFVAELRASGATPEETVVAVKSALRSPSTTPIRIMTADPIVSRVVNWCIEDYFRGD